MDKLVKENTAVDPQLRERAVATARWALHLAGAPPTAAQVKFWMSASAGDSGTFIVDDNWGGFVDCGKPVIWIDSAISPNCLDGVIAHEAKHIADDLKDPNHDHGTNAEMEHDARKFAKVFNWLGDCGSERVHLIEDASYDAVMRELWGINPGDIVVEKRAGEPVKRIFRNRAARRGRPDLVPCGELPW